MKIEIDDPQYDEILQGIIESRSILLSWVEAMDTSSYMLSVLSQNDHFPHILNFHNLHPGPENLQPQFRYVYDDIQNVIFKVSIQESTSLSFASTQPSCFVTLDRLAKSSELDFIVTHMDQEAAAIYKRLKDMTPSERLNETHFIIDSEREKIITETKEMSRFKIQDELMVKNSRPEIRKDQHYVFESEQKVIEAKRMGFSKRSEVIDTYKRGEVKTAQLASPKTTFPKGSETLVIYHSMPEIQGSVRKVTSQKIEVLLPKKGNYGPEDELKFLSLYGTDLEDPILTRISEIDPYEQDDDYVVVSCIIQK
jgi:hypothetical protein